MQITQPKGTVLFRRGEPAVGIYLVKSGRIDLRLENEEGRPVWRRIATRHSIIGLPGTLAKRHYTLTATACETSHLAFVRSRDLIGLMKDAPDIGLELVRAVGDEVCRMRATLASSTTIKKA